MQVRIWNAYASNNSGSYTIVGSLPSREVADEVATELRQLIEAHTAWRRAWDGSGGTDASPLAAFCKQHGLTWGDNAGGFDDWPEHHDDTRPQIAVTSHQLVVHHPYTVSLPTTFGEYIYRRGGRVEHEENHAHHAIVTIASFYWGWTKEARAKMDVERPRLVAAVTAEDGPLEGAYPARWPPGWSLGGDGFGEAPFTVGVLFDDLIGGVAALRTLAEAHGASLQVRLQEAADDLHDPLAHLRPSNPRVPRTDLILTGAGDNRASLVTALWETLQLYEGDARKRLLALPVTLGRGLRPSVAEAAAARLRRSGAIVELRASEL
jgi:hypothetical protein